MGKYVVGVKEVHIVNVPIELSAEEEALPVVSKIDLIKKKAGEKLEEEELEGEYSYTSDMDEWSVSRTR